LLVGRGRVDDGEVRVAGDLHLLVAALDDEQGQIGLQALVQPVALDAGFVVPAVFGVVGRAGVGLEVEAAALEPARDPGIGEHVVGEAVVHAQLGRPGVEGLVRVAASVGDAHEGPAAPQVVILLALVVVAQAQGEGECVPQGVAALAEGRRAQGLGVALLVEGPGHAHVPLHPGGQVVLFVEGVKPATT
jgi:hypothetical protein